MTKRKLLSLILALVFLLTSIPMNISQATTYPVEGVTLELVHFRKSPVSSTANLVNGCETIQKGEKVLVECESDGFLLLKYNGYYGFAPMSSIHIGALPTSTPAVQKTPQPAPSSLRFYADVYSGVTLEKIYFRQNAEAASTPRVVGCETIASGKEIYVLGRNGDFYYISYKGYYGYARMQDIRVYGVAKTTPQPTTAAKPTATAKPTTAPTKTPTPTKAPSGLTYYADQYIGKTKEKVYFRQNPASATTPRVVGCEAIASGKEVTVLGINGNFYYISYKGYYGYARKQDIRVLGKVTASTPTPTPTPLTVAMYPDKYVGGAKEKIYFRQNPTSATTPRVKGCETIASGKEVIVLGEIGDFYYISYNNYKGYARKQDIRIFGKWTPPTPTPAPTSKPTPAPIPGNVTLTSNQRTKWTAVADSLISACAKNKDTRGWIYIPTTNNINYPIMYSPDFYYNDHTPEKKSSSRGSIYMYTDRLSSITTVAGHNSRESGLMFHELHHIQARLLGRSTCESCKKSVSYIDRDNLTFQIMLGGYSTWELFAMYETGKNENKEVLKYNTGHPTLTGNNRRTWINYQLSRSQMNFGVNVGDNEPLMVLITCGDIYESTTQARLYMFLRAVR